MRKDQWCSKFEDSLFGTFKIPFQVDAYQKLIVKNLYLAWIHLNTCSVAKLFRQEICTIKIGIKFRLLFSMFKVQAEHVQPLVNLGEKNGSLTHIAVIFCWRENFDSMHLCHFLGDFSKTLGYINRSIDLTFY